MLIEGGYLTNTLSSSYFYPIRDLKINPVGWNKIIIKNENFEKIILNNNKVVNITEIQNNNYFIHLYLDGDIIYTQRTLFNYTIDIDIENNDNRIVEFVEGFIVDH